MPNIKIISESNLESLIEKTSELFCEMLNQLAEQNPYVVGAWPGGRSLLKFFPAFINVFRKQNQNNLVKQHFFQVDERVYQEFNRDLLSQNLFSDLVFEKLVNPSQIHYYDTQLEPSLGIVNYANVLQAFGGKFNYVMLGAGGPHVRAQSQNIVRYDCHVAGLFAHHPSTSVQEQPFTYYFDSPKPPPGRITATYSLLSKSDWCFLFIMGEEKKEVLKEFLDQNSKIENSPIKIAYEIKNCVVVTDQKA